jgi:hypothetical protein
MTRARVSLPTLIGSLAFLALCVSRAEAQTLTLMPSHGKQTTSAPPAPPQTKYLVKGTGVVQSYDTGYDRFEITVAITRTTPGQLA